MAKRRGKKGGKKRKSTGGVSGSKSFCKGVSKFLGMKECQRAFNAGFLAGRKVSR